MSELDKLQPLRLKGRARPESLATAWHCDAETAQQVLDALVAEGLANEKQGWYGLSEQGEAQRVTALDAERAALDAKALSACYDDFCTLNSDFKQLVTDVQLGALASELAPERLTALHQRFEPLLTRTGETAPRLDSYARRFCAALEALQAGDPRYLASPMVESYHTLWFELHEELIQLLGRTRAEEAAAGRGA